MDKPDSSTDAVLRLIEDIIDKYHKAKEELEYAKLDIKYYKEQIEELLIEIKSLKKN